MSQKNVALVSLGSASLIALVYACGGTADQGPNAGDGGASGGGGTSGTGGNVELLDAGPVTPANPCEAEGAPEQCQLVPSGPACGDGELNQDSEVCDDGNSLPGDGCSGICVVEPYHICPTPGEPCVSTIICGDAEIGPGEACDDGNAVSGDGCSDTCNLVELGYACRTPGEPCVRVYLCGDTILDPNEGCDDGNVTDGDGCDAHCRMEVGFKCEGSPSVCVPTVCGDNIREGAESCDDGNDTPFDGCSALCQAEPDCSGGACLSSCGDGIVLGEICDDGNLRDGDGCSSSCTVEEGYNCDSGTPCELVNGVCSMHVPAVFRDFTTSHPDMEPGGDNQDVVAGMVEPVLDAEGKPVASATGLAGAFLTTADNFRQWYRDSAVSATINGELVLWDNGAGGYVNRWGDNGEQWAGYGNTIWCGNGGTNCGSCTPDQYEVCLEPCTPWNNSAECGVTLTLYDGDPFFFPIDNHPLAITPTGEYSLAKLPPAYDPAASWPSEPNGVPHNFHFTTEVRYWFEYDATVTAQLDFTGDDDVWVFVNGQLALDLGGWHPPLSDSVILDAAAATTYGLVDGSVYEIAVFHAERMTEGSSFRLTLSGFDMAPSLCLTDCGDGVVAPGEACDDGPANRGGYNECTPTCELGPRCGDGVTQDQYGEVCDDGVNDGAYGGCAPSCQPGPHCGDGIVQPEHEQCDDGLNDGGYGECSAGCVLGPYCGDGNVSLEFEDCDDGNSEDGDGCTGACVEEIAVPA